MMALQCRNVLQHSIELKSTETEIKIQFTYPNIRHAFFPNSLPEKRAWGLKTAQKTKQILCM
jgi:hypothetical protein